MPIRSSLANIKVHEVQGGLVGDELILTEQVVTG